MVESYYPNTVPDLCFDEESSGSPTVTIRVDKAPQTIIVALTYDDIGIQPILIPANTYSAGETFNVYVKYEWMGSPANDFTLSVYSAEKDL